MSYDPNNDYANRTTPPPAPGAPADHYQRTETIRETRVERETGGLTWLVVALLVIAVIAALYFLWRPADAPTGTTTAPPAVEQTAPAATDVAPATDAAPAETAPAN